MITLGSLFDGSGGFPLAGVINGIIPMWSSEIEPYPLRVTAARFPNVKQLGSVLDINGAEIEPVDIITFGSPCQDLSVAGKQLGIHDGERSNLFFEAIRIIKEMRDATRADKHIRPRFAVWENVPGAFSSNKGEDFRAVLQAFASVCSDGLDIPRPPHGKWNHAGGVAGDGWSVAWRVYDAQYWGVPQRRKRIYLIADFGSERAGEILFEREGLRGNPAESGTAGKGVAADAERSVGGSCIAFKERAGKPGGGKGILPAIDRAFTLATNVDQSVCYGIKGNYIDRDTRQNCVGWRGGEMYTLDATDRHAVCYRKQSKPRSSEDAETWIDDGVTNTLNTYENSDVRTTEAIVYRNSSYGNMVEGVGTLRASGGDVGGVRKASSLSIYDARGNGDGMIAPTMTGDHENRITDYTTVLVEKHE